MIKRLLLTFACLLIAPLAHAQFGNTTTIPASGAPAGSCGPLLFYVNTANGDLYDCLTGSWHAIGGGGGGTGTVTSVTFTGDGTILSATPSAAVTTSGTVTAALATAAAGTVLGNATGSTAAPTYTAAPVVTSITTGNGTAGSPTISPRAGSAIGIWSSGVGQLSLNTASATSTIGLYAAAVNNSTFTLGATSLTLAMVPTNSTLAFTHNLTTTAGSFGTLFNTPNPYTGTSSQFFHTESRGSFGPTSGTAGMYGLMVDPVINTTSTYSGIVAGVGIYPILTSVTGATVRTLAIGTSSAVGPTGTLTTNLAIDTSGKEIFPNSCAASGTAANPSVVSCSAANAGIVYCDVAASAGTCTINTTAVTVNSLVMITPSGATADGTILSKTCNTATTFAAVPILAAKVAATSFTINMPTVVTNGACFEYRIVN